MRIKPMLIALFGLGVAGGSVFMAKEVLVDQTGAAVASEPATVDIVVARGPIAFGQTIEAQLLTTQSWPRESLPGGAYTRIEEVVATNGEQQRRAKDAFFEGEVLLASKLSAPGEKVTIVQKLSENTRAMAIKVDAVTAVGGFVTPGDSVDIVMTQGSGEDLRAVTILQNIRVVGVDQTAEERTDAPAVAQTVTVEVTPEQGQRLALAQNAGKLSLTLRTHDSTADQPLQMIDLRDLLQEESPVAEVKRKRTVTVRRANDAQLVEIN